MWREGRPSLIVCLPCENLAQIYPHEVACYWQLTRTWRYWGPFVSIQFLLRALESSVNNRTVESFMHLVGYLFSISPRGKWFCYFNILSYHLTCLDYSIRLNWTNIRTLTVGSQWRHKITKYGNGLSVYIHIWQICDVTVRLLFVWVY